MSIIVVCEIEIDLGGHKLVNAAQTFINKIAYRYIILIRRGGKVTV